MHMDCLLPVSHADGEEPGRVLDHHIRPIIEWRKWQHVAVSMDQNAVGGQERVGVSLQGLMVGCGVVAGLWSSGGLADNAEVLQLLLKGLLGRLRIGAVRRQL